MTLLEAQPVNYDELVFAFVFYGVAAVLFVATMTFGMWFIMTPLYHRWGAGVRLAPGSGTP